MTSSLLSGTKALALAAACLWGFCPAAATAQSSRGAPAPAAASTPFQGFQQNNKEPIKIESISLEVRDKERIATFIDNVKLVQGDTTLECRRLIVYYDDEPAPGAGKGKQAPKSTLTSAPAGGQQQIRRLEAKGGVVVTQKDQTATGDNGVYEMKSNSILLTGNVVMTRGNDVVKGDKLFVDMTTGLYRVESGTTGQGGPVRALFNPGSSKPAGGNAAGDQPAAPGGARPAGPGSDRTGTTASSEKDKSKQGASRPLKLN